MNGSVGSSTGGLGERPPIIASIGKSNASRDGLEISALVPWPFSAMPTRRFHVLMLVLGGAVVLGMIWVLFLFDPAFHAFYPQCLFHRATGLLCPGCGSLRAMHQLLHGHLVAAIHLNLLCVVLVPIGGVFLIRAAWRNLNGRPGWARCPALLLWAGIGLGVVFAILRNLPFAPSWLVP